MSRELRREEAVVRQEHWNNLSFESQLKVLDCRPGESKKQRLRIVDGIDKRDEQSRLAKRQEDKKKK